MTQDISNLCVVLSNDERKYLGRDSAVAERVAEKAQGKAILRIYHKTEDGVRVEDHSFLDGKRTEYNAYYISSADINILSAVLGERASN